MRIGRNLMREVRMFLFQLRSIRGVLWIPAAVEFFLLPWLLVLTMKKYQDIWYVEDTFQLMTQYLVPVLSVWWLSFAFIEMIEGDGSELHYVNHRMKDNLVLLWLGAYLLMTALGCGIASMWIGNAWMEFLRMVICSCFYVGLAYGTMFWSGSMTVTFLVVVIYWMASLFGGNFPLPILNCYDGLAMSMELLSAKYVYIMLTAVVLYVLGCIGNQRKERYV